MARSTTSFEMQDRGVLFVANKKLPSHDYRTEFALRSERWRILLGLPERPDSLPPEQFVRFGFREGVDPSDLLELYRLFRYLRRCQEDLLAAHFFSTKLTLFGPVLACLAGVRSIVTVTGLGRTFNDTRLRYRVLGGLYRLLFRASASCASRILFQNSGDLARVTAWFPFIRHRTELVGSAVSPASFEATDYEARPLTVLMVSRLLPSKGIEDFLDIARGMLDENVRFVLVGPPSPGETALYKNVLQAANEGVIDYRGELHGDAMHAAYQDAHVFLFPSHGEGMPRVMLEAGVAGLCPVAYDISANRDLVGDGRGFLVPYKDRTAARDTLFQLLGDRETLARNALAFQDFVLDRYAPERYQERLDRILESLLTDGALERPL